MSDMDTTNPEYAAWKWLTDRTAEEAETCLDLLDELKRLRARVAELESATEWGAKWSDAGYAPSVPPRSEEWARQHERVWSTRPIRRHVGPWVYADTGEVVWP